MKEKNYGYFSIKLILVYYFFFKWNFYKKNRALNGEKLENNIRLIGALKKRKELIERFGLFREDDGDVQLVYKV